MGGLLTNRTVNGFAVDLGNPKIMYVAMRDGLFKSTDAGNTWKKFGNDLKNLATVTVNSKNSSEVYVATVDGKIFASADGGVSWKTKR